MFKKQISLFIATFLIISFFFLALPENGYSDTNGPPIVNGCCQYVIDGTGEPACEDISGPLICPFIGGQTEVDFFEGEHCTLSTGQCITPVVKSPIPTLSEWGMITVAVVLGIVGIVGFIVIRRRKVTA